MNSHLLAAGSNPQGYTVDLLDKAGGAYANTGTTPNIIAIILNIITGALSLLGVIFLVLIIYAGWNYLTAGGDEGKVETAKHTITRAVIGLAIVLTSVAVVQFVVPLLLCATGVSGTCDFFNPA